MKRNLLFILGLTSLFACKDNEEAKKSLYSNWENFYSEPDQVFYISTMALDNNENIWFSCYSDTCSLRKLSGNSWTYFKPQNDSLLDENYDLIFQNEMQKLWKGNGLIIDYNTSIRYDNTTFRYWSVYNSNIPFISSKVKADEEGNIWQCTSNGLKKFSNGSWQVYNKDNSPFPTSNIAAICFDSEWNLFLSTLPDRGTKGVVMHYDGNSWETLYTCSEPGNWVASMAFDKNGKLWLGILNREAIGNEYGGGLIALDGNSQENYTIENSGLPSNSVVNLWLDKEENLWIGTYNGGLCRFDRKDTWTVFDNSNSPLPYLNSVEHIVSDSKGNIWMGVQYYGLATLTPN